MKSEIEKFDHTLPLDEAKMPPASWYTSQDFFQSDTSTIIPNTWQPIARINELNENNSYISGQVGNIPWVLTKDNKGKVRAFYNVCPHKGREIVTNSSSNCELTCGYHAWKFSLQGELKSVNNAGPIKNFNKSEFKLEEIHLESWGHWFFINTSSRPNAIEKELSVLSGELDKRKWKKLKFHSSKEWTIKCNWKVYIDNYLDGGYHIPHMHPSLDAQLDMSTYQTKCYESYSLQTSPATTDNNHNLEYNPQNRIGEGSIYAWIYPNFMINLYGDCLDTNHVIPVDKDTCKVRYEFYFDEKTDDQFIETSIKQSDITQIEDIEICESVQKGLNSGKYKEGRYAPNFEKGEYHFHQILKEDYQNLFL